MHTRSFAPRLRRWFGTLASIAFTVAAAVTATAQTTTGTIRGYITSQGQPATGATVTATNIANGATRSAVAATSGLYVLTGLVPGQYDVSVRRVGLSPQTRRQVVGIGQVIQLDIALTAVATQLGAVTVQASRGAIETRTSEVATNVSQAQIANLPTADRNFLGLASLAPGVRISGENAEGTTKSFRAGALDAGSINVFIDGASQKNDVTGSGIAGQDASRGNPFPQNAVQEFRVITQNFKAEYQKASSAIIVATTKSGSNTWSGSAFGTYVNNDFVALDSFQRRNRAGNPSFALQDYRRYLAGATLGGPIIRNKLFFFGSYEMNNQNRGQSVNFNTVPSTAVIPADVVQRFATNTGSYQSPFRSNLFLGKLNYSASDETSYELSYNGRFETDVRSFGGQTSIESAENVRNKVNSVVAKRSWSSGPQLHETLFNFSRWNWDPTPENRTLVGLDYQGIGRLGGRDGGQSWVQDRYSIRHDYTYSGLQLAGDHVIKVGGNYDRLNYSASKTFVRPPVFRFNSAENFAFPREAQYGTGNPDITADNNQFGLYAQDDWSPTKRLQFNLGVRWDVETNQFDRNYVTPSQVRADLDSVLRNRGFDPGTYFSDGSQRKIFFGAIQPRAGFSYALDEAQRTTVFGSFGLFYDRSNFNNGLDERFRLQYAIRTFRFSSDGLPRDGFQTIQWNSSYLSAAGLDGLIASGLAPKPEVFLIRNDQKPPVSTQYSAGIRQVLGSWRAAATYTNVSSRNGFTFIFGNRTAEGNCCATVSSNYSNVLLSDNSPRTWYQALMLQLDRPYTFVARDKFNWGMGVAYTYAQGRQRGGDLFSLDYPSVSAYPKFPTSIDVPNLLVANWIVDIPYLWGINYSGVIRLHSGDPYTIVDQTLGSGGGQQKLLLNSGRPPKKRFLVPGNVWGYRNVDMRLRKDLFTARSVNRIGVTADLFNAFNFDNLGCWDGFIPTPPGTNANFGRANCVSADARRFQAGLTVDF
ncbi:MAG: TonB-dependent receptor [Gemmatimonadaceae bacterium]|nr:TonB-dependent receptor [Gemmatimonadaceae bacterium]